MMKLPKILRRKRSSSSLEDSSTHSHASSSSDSVKSPASLSPKHGFLSPKSSFKASTSLARVLTPLRSSSGRSSEQGIKAELEAVFRFIDTNGDGKISIAELESVLKSLGDAPTVEELHKMVEEVDSDGDGHISLEEFVQFNAASASNLAELKAAFHVFDIDKNGYITADELHKVLVSLGEKGLTREDCGRMIRGVDSDGDGFVDFEEFKVMMMASA